MNNKMKSFRCDDKLWQDLTEMCDYLKLNKSDFIRMSIVALIENYKNKPILNDKR